jgi:hypothetical protein
LDIHGHLIGRIAVQYAVMHEGVPVGYVDLAAGELVAGPLVPLPAFEALRPTVQAGSAALLAVGFFGAATPAGQNGAGAALHAAAVLQFDLVDVRGELVPATFVNLIEAPDGGLVVLARLAHAHARVPAVRPMPPRASADAERPGAAEEDV